MTKKTNSLNYVDVKFNNVNSNSENIIGINLKLFHFFFLDKLLILSSR